MEINFMTDGERPDLPRQYVAAALIANFRGHKDVETHLFRDGWTKEEAEEMASLNLIADPSGPLPEALAAVSREASLECALETFSRAEAEELIAYLERRYAGQISRLDVAPMELPAPRGVIGLNRIPATETSGFIDFYKAKDYPLSFRLRGYYSFEAPT